MDRIENIIISNLIHNEEYTRKVLPFIDKAYFNDRLESILVNEIGTFFTKYNKLVTPQILQIEVSNRKDISDKELQLLSEKIDSYLPKEINRTWLELETEKFCKDKSVYNAILRSIKIIEGKDNEFKEDAIPTILSDALAVSFDSNVGHDYLTDADARFDFYHNVEEKLPFDIQLLNEITGGGLGKGTVAAILAGTGVGKSLAMCHFASAALLTNKNVLYITLEMAEEKIAERIDANLLNIPIQDLKTIDRQLFNTRIDKLKQKSTGKLIIKQYPTSNAHTGHFRALLEELKMKQQFIPDLLIIDYINICASSRLKFGGSVNSYTYIKSIAEELRGLAIEYKLPIITATQSTRGASNSSDLEMSDVSESYGLAHTLDLFLGIISTEEMEEMGQLLFRQLKNRYNDVNHHKRFVVGVDRSKMRLFDVESQASTHNVSSNQNYNKPVDIPITSSFNKKQIDSSSFQF